MNIYAIHDEQIISNFINNFIREDYLNQVFDVDIIFDTRKYSLKGYFLHILSKIKIENIR